LEVWIEYIEKINHTKEVYTTYKSLIEKAESLARENGVNTVKISGYPLSKSKSQVPFVEAGYSIYQNPDPWGFYPIERTKTLK
jgi:hypothetical protein